MKPTFLDWLGDKGQKLLKALYAVASGNWHGRWGWEFAPTVMFYGILWTIMVPVTFPNLGLSLWSSVVIWATCLGVFLRAKYRNEMEE